MNASNLRPSIEELRRTTFVQPLTSEREAALEDELSYFERFLKNETAGDIREYLCIPYSEFWHRTKKVVSLICTEYASFYRLERFKKSSFIDKLHISRLIDAIAEQDDIKSIIQERTHLKSYVRWLIMNHTRGNHALVNKLKRTHPELEVQGRSLDPEGGIHNLPVRPASRQEGIPSRRRRPSSYALDDGFANYRIGTTSPTSPSSRRHSGYYLSDDGYSDYRGEHAYGESYEPLQRAISSGSSYDGTMSPRRQSIKITDILNEDEREDYRFR